MKLILLLINLSYWKYALTKLDFTFPENNDLFKSSFSREIPVVKLELLFKFLKNLISDFNNLW